MNILFIGGTGTISLDVSKEVIKRGHSLTLLRRSNTPIEGLEKANTIQCDINDTLNVKKALDAKFYDAIVDFIAFNEDDIERDYELFKGKTHHYIFISSASGYQKPIPYLPVKETIPFDNKYWDYSQNKAKAEKRLFNIKDKTFNVTAIRPSHTYDDDKIVAPFNSDSAPYTLIDRILNGKSIVIPMEGTSKWTLTHSKDFAKAFVDILGNKQAYNDYFHLTSHFTYTWNEIIKALFDALDQPYNIKHVSLEVLLEYFPSLKGPLLGDKLHDMVLDNQKIRNIAPSYQSIIDYKTRINTIVKSYLEDESLQTVDHAFDQTLDELVKLL